MPKHKYEHRCENCKKDFDNLYNRSGVTPKKLVEWVCKNCYERVFGINWEEDFKDRNEK